ncbi:uncharacterized protein BDV17DRAFT_265140 [Aspergillus undulatus]|uniref:uncharacterized protein n=1 Tax=Aspergillus undulatus TaxID=1810928 RepID=UPI003CCE4163
MNKTWTGLELSGSTAWLDTSNTPSSAKHSRKLVSKLAHFISAQGVTTYEITVGFWTPTKEWRFRAEAKKPTIRIATPTEQKKIDTDWMIPIREKFAEYAGSGLVNERSIHDRNFADWEDWIYNVEDPSRWRHFTQFCIYRGMPFLEVKDGVLNGKDIMDLADMRAHDLKVMGYLPAETRQPPASSWTGGREDLVVILKGLVE